MVWSNADNDAVLAALKTFFPVDCGLEARFLIPSKVLIHRSTDGINTIRAFRVFVNYLAKYGDPSARLASGEQLRITRAAPL
jgi:hypothetical protein